jgi:hypothetical protein
MGDREGAAKGWKTMYLGLGLRLKAIYTCFFF